MAFPKKEDRYPKQENREEIHLCWYLQKNHILQHNILWQTPTIWQKSKETLQYTKNLKPRLDIEAQTLKNTTKSAWLASPNMLMSVPLENNTLIVSSKKAKQPGHLPIEQWAMDS